jgi:hypothetical protein
VKLLKLKKIQKRALRYASLDNKSTYEQLLQICHKSPLYIIRLRKIVELVYMISINTCPSYLKSLVTSNACNNNIRYVNNMQIPRFKTVPYGKRSIRYNAPLLWNSLSEDMKTSQTLSAFKQNVKLWYGIECHCGFCTSCKINSQ